MIRFETEDCDFPVINESDVRKWIRKVAASHHKTIGEIHYLFCSDERMLEHNKEYLNHDYYTDVITFDYSEFPIIAGDIIVGIDTVRSNADALGVPYQQELLRVIIHGILHLCGFKDKTPEDESNMHEQEDNALILL